MTRRLETVERRIVYRAPIFVLEEETVRFPDGRTSRLSIVHHPGAAAIVPLVDDGDVVLIRQYRHATGETLLEVPAGTLGPQEEPESCAARELIEETGYRAGRLRPLGWIWTTPGFTDERIWLYLADQLAPAEQSLDVDEILEVEQLPLGRAVQMALQGDIQDGKSVVALLRAAAQLGL